MAQLSQPGAFTFASHAPEDESDDDNGNSSSELRARPPLRRSSAAATTTTTAATTPGVAAPGSPALARARTSIATDENAPANDVPFEEIAALLAARNANNSAVGEQVKVGASRKDGLRVVWVY